MTSAGSVSARSCPSGSVAKPDVGSSLSVRLNRRMSTSDSQNVGIPKAIVDSSRMEWSTGRLRRRPEMTPRGIGDEQRDEHAVRHQRRADRDPRQQQRPDRRPQQDGVAQVQSQRTGQEGQVLVQPRRIEVQLRGEGRDGLRASPAAPASG